MISTVAGAILSPLATNLIEPLEYALGSEFNLDIITLHFTRLVLGVQLVLTGAQLPGSYLKKEWRPLAILLAPGLTLMWLLTSLMVWALVPNIGFLYSLAIAAAVTPTDPVLSSSIVKGRFADRHIPEELRKLIVAESGANDGLGYSFLFLPLLLIRYAGYRGIRGEGDAGKAVGLWFGETLGYTVLLSVVYGALVGWISRKLLRWAQKHRFMVKESFLIYPIALAVGALARNH